MKINAVRLSALLLVASLSGCANEREAQLQAERDRKYQQHLRDLAPLFGVLCAAGQMRGCMREPERTSSEAK